MRVSSVRIPIEANPLTRKLGPGPCPGCREGLSDYASEAATPSEGRSSLAKRKLHLYFGTVKSATGGRHIMVWANSREHALDLVEAALNANEPVQGSVVGPLASLPADVMEPGVYVKVPPA
jgi:hypothetical protein